MHDAIDRALTLEQLVNQAKVHFETRFGRPSQWIAAAPGRVNLIGEHTDYNDGFVLPMAIERYVVIAADRPSHPEQRDSSIQVHSEATGETKTIDLSQKETQQNATWTNYVQGVFVGCRAVGKGAGPLDLLIESNVPLGGGLSSSAAIEVATATLIEATTGQTMEPRQKALLCQKAEHEYAGVPCGIMDQFTSVFGQPDHFLLLDCRSTETDLVPFTDPQVTVLIINSNVKHDLTGGEYAERRQQCEEAARRLGVPALRDTTLSQLAEARAELDDVLYRRARHVIGEIERTQEAADAIRNGNWARVGQLMYASHQSLRDDYEVSCPELDLLVELAKELGTSDGVIGSRMTGGGFGGCTVSLVASGAVISVANAIHKKYQDETGIVPTLFVSRPARGAHIVES